MSRIVLLAGKATGGIGVHVRDLSVGLRDLGHDVRVVTDRLTATTFGLADALLLWPDLRRPDPRAVARLRSTLVAADVVHAQGHQATILAGTLLAGVSRTRRPRFAASLHNEFPSAASRSGRAALALERRALRRADLVTGASSDLVTAARTLGARRARLAEVSSPRVLDLLAAGPRERAAARERVAAAYGLTRGEPLILTISRVAPQKDLPTLLDAASTLSVPGAWLVVGGGIPHLLSELRARVEREHLPVRFLGPVSDPGDLLLAADLFVLTSRWEARALVVQEAMAGGIPVVAPNVGGLTDLLAEGGGRLVSPGSAGQIASAADYFLSDAAASAAAADRGRAVAAGWPSVADTTRAWSAAYDALILG
ncbi:MAG: glycosyltransferase family 4 protein [Actinobacteria bacterium]|nr:glycosyltransferase family 4 protein [Actinomycetota bacterium]